MTMERAGSLISGRFLGSILPVLLGVLGAATANIPVSFLANFLPPPLLSFMPLYFWAIVRPDLMTPFWAFALGVLEDFFSGGPPGLWAVSYLAAYAFVDNQRDMLAGLSGLGAIAGFAVACAAACGTAYFVADIYYWRLQPIAPIVAQLAVTVIEYVFAVFALGAVHRRLVGPLRSDF